MEQLIPGLPNDIARDCLFRIPYSFLSDSSYVCKDWNHEIEQPDFLRLRKATGRSQAIVVMAQARSNRGNRTPPEFRLSVFEPKSSKWEELPLFSGFSKGLPRFCQVVGVGSDLVVMGGLDPCTWEVSNSVFIYNFVSATWRCGANMPGVKRSFFGCTSDDDKRMVFVAGGHDNEKNALRSTMAYDVAKNKWIIMADMIRERDECKALFHHGKLHVISGYCTITQGQFERSIETFNPVTSKWEVKEDFLPANVSPKSCVAGHDGKLYMSSESHMTAWDGAAWQAVSQIPADVGSATTWQEKLLVTGSGEGQMAYVLDLSSYSWTKIKMPEECRGHVYSSCYLEI
ncbi:F-box/kelch-repeat protein At1g80440-like [Argentina anserina]|uniref:F-box/kelch-repeat protein At1g80440-like n=1 Tax=Argentina anserina TaxID=57926 RepID=UPI00217690F4|nr:F-box/kelch-repeat protein At1g80440-like [Potentilla anserina]